MGRMVKMSDGSVSGIKKLTITGATKTENYTWNLSGPMASVLFYDTAGTYNGVAQILGSHDGTNYAVINASVTQPGVFQITSPIPHIKVQGDGATGSAGTIIVSVVEWVD
jgi:hypothetical protein